MTQVRRSNNVQITLDINIVATSRKQIRLQIEIPIERTPFYGSVIKVIHKQYSS